MGFSGAGLFDWSAVAVVLRDFHGVDIDGDLHRRLRICMMELLQVESESKDLGKGASDG
jgi:hypothetical protein